MVEAASLAALAALFFVLHAQPPGPNTDLATLLKQNPGEYALSFGHFLDLNARWMVPMHYGTFRLSHEPIDEPLQLLEKEAEAAGITDRVVVLEEGVTKFF